MDRVLTIETDTRGVAWLGLNRPEVHNAFDAELMQAITHTIQALAANDSVRMAVLFGHGKSFSAGGDLNWMRSMKDYSYEENIADSEVLANMFSALHAFPKPLLGVVHGVALGGGSGLAAMCDYVIATENARFGFTETRLGLLPAVISPYVLEKIGVSAARAHFISGAPFTAAEALRIGLTHELSSVEAIERARDTRIDAFLHAAPNASISAKALIRTLQSLDTPESARSITLETIAKARIGEEAQEGMASLLEGGTPLMAGRMKRILIANRGEIACRIAASCAHMGIETVMIYASDEQGAPHAQMGNMAMMLEGDALHDTYLNMKQIIAIAKQTGADGIHPGYGFLSENAAFSEAVETAGIAFIGPSANVIATMGDKAASRQLCQSIGVPVVPGYDGDKTDDTTLAKKADAIGYPVLIKAAAGGGGKGMRIVESNDAFAAALETARSEAQHAFGDDRILLEKYVSNPRHIEVQVFSDSHGNHLHMFERECSIQRRHQKIIEESPSPDLTDARRADMVEAALTITRHIGYVGAGTVEFIVDGNTGDFYFLEMNTRLQVEHPVTESISGLDLVRLQIIAARGDALPITQSDIVANGHAIEVRLYAEDPEKEFMPSPGRLHQFVLPHAPWLRCESGVTSGSEVTPRYDPMLAKLTVWAPSRSEAIARMQHALNETRIAGVANNRAFLQRVLAHDAFMHGALSTHFIADHRDALSVQPLNEAQAAAFIAAALLAPHALASPANASAIKEHSAWTESTLAGWR